MIIKERYYRTWTIDLNLMNSAYHDDIRRQAYQKMVELIIEKHGFGKRMDFKVGQIKYEVTGPKQSPTLTGELESEIFIED